MRNLFIPLLLIILISCSKTPLQKAEAEFETAVKQRILDPGSFELLKFEFIDTLYHHTDDFILKKLRKLAKEPVDETLNKALNSIENSRNKSIDVYTQLAEIFNSNKEYYKLNSFYRSSVFTIEFCTPNNKVANILREYFKTHYKSDTILGYKAYAVYKKTNKLGLKGITEDIAGIDNNLKTQVIKDIK